MTARSALMVAALAVALAPAAVIWWRYVAPAPTPTFPRDEAIRAATAEAHRAAPELDLQDARITAVTAELTTLADADRRRGIEHPGGGAAGRDGRTPVWWVTVAGSFRYRGMSAAGAAAAPLQETGQRVFIYDARSGAPLGGATGSARAITPALGS